MGLIETIKTKIFRTSEQIPVNPELELLHRFYANPYAVHYLHKTEVTYSGQYQNLLYDYDLKGLPVLQDEADNQLQVSFLWTDPHYISWIDRGTFQGIIKPYSFVYTDLTENPAIIIQAKPNKVVRYDEYSNLWEERAKMAKKLGL